MKSGDSLKSELKSISIARGLAAFGVFVYHYGMGGILTKYTGVPLFENVNTFGALYGVPLFFVISGFCVHGSEWRRTVLSNKRVDWIGYSKRRFLRIYPAYIAALAVSIAVGVASGSTYSLGDIATHLVVLQGFSVAYFNSINLVLWTISIEMSFYVIYPIWYIVRIKTNLVVALSIGVGLSLLSCLFSAFALSTYNYPIKWFFLSTWSGWLFGAFLFELIIDNRSLIPSVLWWSIGAIVLLVYIYIDRLAVSKESADIFLVPLRAILCTWLLSFLISCELFLKHGSLLVILPSRALGLVGLFSYSLYLFHEPMIRLRNIVQESVPPGAPRMFIQGSWFFGILGVSYLSYRFIERRFAS
jgi:peptidoglycan/LPS O-acetylase OafA/YrhL